MRIISGKHKGEKLFSPKTTKIRPTSDRAKEVIFSTLNSILIKKKKSFGDFIALDAFCGSGSLGIEALSRGVKKVYFIDNSKESTNLVKKNCQSIGFGNKANIIKMNLLHCKPLKLKANLFFLDPPYNKFDLDKIVNILTESEMVAGQCIGVIELPKEERKKNIKYFTNINTKIVSNSCFLFLEKK